MNISYDGANGLFRCEPCVSMIEYVLLKCSVILDKPCSVLKELNLGYLMLALSDSIPYPIKAAVSIKPRSSLAVLVVASRE